MRRFVKFVFKFVLTFTLVIALALGILIWRVASQPVSSTTLTPYIEAALSSLLPDTKAEVAETLLVWDNKDRSLAFRGTGFKLRDNTENVIAESPSMKMKLSVLGLLAGQFIPSELIIEQPQLWFNRRADGTISFGSMVTGETTAAPAQEQAPVKDIVQTIADQVTHGRLLQDVAITNAMLFIHDEETRQDWAIRIPEISLHHGWRTITGKAQIEVTQKDKGSLIEANYDFDRRRSLHNITLSFTSLNPSFIAGRHPKLASIASFDLPLSGEISFSTDRELNVVSSATKINGGEGVINAPSVWDKPRSVKNFSLSAQYDRKTHQLSISSTNITFDDTTFTLDVQGSPPPDESTGTNGKPFDMAFMMRVSVNKIPMDHFASIWPSPIITNARAWIMANMSKGQFNDGEVTINGKFAWDDLENMVLDSGNGKISARNGTIHYINGMPNVEGVDADATFDLDRMDVKISNGGIGALKIQPFTIEMTDFQKNVQIIYIPLKINGPVRDVIKFLDEPALGYASAVGLRSDDGKGKVEGSIELRFPMLNAILMKDIDYKATAKITDFAAQKMVPGLIISQGNLSLSLDKAGFALKGPASLNKVPAEIAWENRFGDNEVDTGKPRSSATVTGNLSGDQWAQLGLELLNKVKGNSAINIRFAQFDNAPAQLTGNVNFKEAEVRIDDLNWSKASGIPAQLEFAAVLPKEGDIALKSIDLQGANLKIKGSGRLDGKSMQLLAIDLKPVIVGRTNVNKLSFAQSSSATGEMRFTVEGEAFDVSGMTGGKDPGKSDPRPKIYKIKLGKIITSDVGFISNVQIQARRDPQGWADIELRGMADGGHPLDISLKPVGNRRTLSITCDDFGKALKGMGFTDTVKDGPIEIKGESTPENPRVIEGTVKIGHFLVTGLPVLARLLSAASPFGFIDLVTGNASFDRLEGQFRWQGDAIDLIKVRAAGSVFGLNIDGHLDMNTGATNLHGTLVPFSFFNSIINVIPLLGDVITGGEGQGVIAASYTVKGTLGEPDISVNPVSLLTPGFLRNLFFAGDDTPEKPPEQPAPVKETKQKADK